MKRSIVRGVIGLLIAGAAPANTPFSVNGPGGLIPGVGTGGGVWPNYGSGEGQTTSSVMVPDSIKSVTSVVITDVSHSWVGDLQFTLRGPDGVEYTLVHRPGFNGVGFGSDGELFPGTTLTLVPSGGAAIPQSGDIPSGTYNQSFGVWVSGIGNTFNTNLTAIVGLPGAWTLVIRDWAPGDTGVFGGWSLNAEVVGPSGADGDECLDAVPITGLGVFPFDNTDATTDGNSHYQCVGTGGQQVFRDVWWLWTSTVTGPVRVTTCGMTMIDARVVIYDGGVGCNAGSGGVIACGLGCDGVDGFTFHAHDGEDYLIRLGVGPDDPLRGQGSGGSGSMALDEVVVPLCTDDDCQALGETTFSYNSDNATFRVADDWTAPASGAIDSLCFWGSYDDDDPDDVTDAFRVVYYRDDGGVPGQPIAEFKENLIAVTPAKLSLMSKVPTELRTTLSMRLVHKYSACHAPVPVEKGQRYWIEVTNDSDADGAWGWSHAGSYGTGALQDDSPNDPYGLALPISDLALCVGFAAGCPLDANGDFVIDFADLNLIVSSINSACP